MLQFAKRAYRISIEIQIKRLYNYRDAQNVHFRVDFSPELLIFLSEWNIYSCVIFIYRMYQMYQAAAEKMCCCAVLPKLLLLFAGSELLCMRKYIIFDTLCRTVYSANWYACSQKKLDAWFIYKLHNRISSGFLAKKKKSVFHVLPCIILSYLNFMLIFMANICQNICLCDLAMDSSICFEWWLCFADIN